MNNLTLEEQVELFRQMDPTGFKNAWHNIRMISTWTRRHSQVVPKCREYGLSRDDYDFIYEEDPTLYAEIEFGLLGDRDAALQAIEMTYERMHAWFRRMDEIAVRHLMREMKAEKGAGEALELPADFAEDVCS